MSMRVVTIGNFDGVHRGHARLIELAREKASSSGEVIALVFDPHPSAKLRGSAPPRLSTFPQREGWLRELGVDRVDRLDPTPELLGLSAEGFVEWLVDCFDPGCVVEGHDFGFGKGRSGDVDTLAALGKAKGFEVVVADEVEVSLPNQVLVRVSSTLIREMIRLGRVGDAEVLLGRPYEIVGTVEKGDQRGRTIGFPTANVRTDQLLPGDGVYAGEGELGNGRVFGAAVHVGPRPVFGDERCVLEAYLLDADLPIPVSDDQYGWDIRVRPSRYLRDLGAFDGVQALVEQIGRDVERTREIMRQETASPA
ncbi:MAG: bifunctional riboflavin kinase/FMN adenylyltransferase [Planctomycetota bacterium]